jgi:hypothetical protein
LHLNPCRYNKDFFNAAKGASLATAALIGPKLLKDAGTGGKSAAAAAPALLSFDFATGHHMAVTSAKEMKLTSFYAPTSTRGITIPKRPLEIQELPDDEQGAGAGGGSSATGKDAHSDGAGAGAGAGASADASLTSPSKRTRT